MHPQTHLRASSQDQGTFMNSVCQREVCGFLIPDIPDIQGEGSPLGLQPSLLGINLP